MKNPNFFALLKLLSYLSGANFFLLLRELLWRCFWDLNVFRREFFSEKRARKQEGGLILLFASSESSSDFDLLTDRFEIRIELVIDEFMCDI